jgi:hypothetical protein
VSEDPTSGRPDFDELARGLANGSLSRRRALKLFVATALGSLVPARFAAADPPEKVTICHKPGTPAEKTMYLPESAVRGHMGHGDCLGPCPCKTTSSTTTSPTTSSTTTSPTTSSTTTNPNTTSTTQETAPAEGDTTSIEGARRRCLKKGGDFCSHRGGRICCGKGGRRRRACCGVNGAACCSPSQRCDQGRCRRHRRHHH